MSYSCSDLADDVFGQLAELGLIPDAGSDHYADDPSEQADAIFAAIDALVATGNLQAAVAKRRAGLVAEAHAGGSDA